MNAEKCASRSFRSQPVALPISSGAGGYPAELSVVQRGLKKPSLEGFCGNCVSTTLLERMGEPRIDGQWLLGGFSFGVASSAVHNSPPSQDGEILPVEVPPLQTHDFTGAKGKTCRNQNHRVVWLDQLRQKEADLARRQHARYASATAPLSYQVDGISIGQFPSSCMLIDKVKQASKVDLGLRCQGKRPQPLFDCKRLDLLQQRVTPAGANPAVQIRGMRLLG